MMRSQALTSRQFIFAIYKTQIGVGILALPRELAEKSGTSGLLTPLIAYAVSIGLSFLIVHSLRRYPGLSFQDLMVRLFGRIAGWILNAIWSLYMLYAAAAVLIITIYILQIWVLQETSGYKVVLLMLIPIYMVCRHSETLLGRYAEFVFLSSVWIYPMLLFPLRDSSMLNLLPLLPNGAGPVFAAIPTAVVPYLGLEAAMFLYPRHNRPEKAFRDLVIANTCSTTLYVGVTLICFAFFDNRQIRHHLWPTLELFKTVKFSFIERFELVFLPFYLIVIVYTSIMYLFLGTRTAAHLLGRRNHLPLLRVACAALFGAVLLYEPSFAYTQTLSRVLSLCGYAALLFPVLLWIRTRFAPSLSKEGSTA